MWDEQYFTKYYSHPNSMWRIFQTQPIHLKLAVGSPYALERGI